MEILPGEGTDIIKFGMNHEKVEALLGKPKKVMPYDDTPGYPQDREIWDYWPLEILMTPAHGVTSITAYCEAAEPRLWGHSLADCKADTITRLINQSGEKNEINEHSYVDEYDIYLPAAGLIFNLMDDELVSIEVMSPHWQSPD